MPAEKLKGIRLERKKDATLLNTLKRPYAVKRVRIPLYGGPDTGVIPCVKEGESVLLGQRIADPKSPEGVPVYAGLAGKVERIEPALMPDGSQCRVLEISGDGEPKQPAPPLRHNASDEPVPGRESVGARLPPACHPSGRDRQGQASFPETRKETEEPSREELPGIFRERGLLSMDEKMVPLHARIRKSPAVRTVVINCCEPEPYVASGQALLAAHPVEVLKGAGLLRKAAGAEKAVFIFEDAGREVFELIKSKIYLSKQSSLEARMVPSVYPAGCENILSKEFPGETIAWNASTAYAVYEAVCLGKPFHERIVTVGGECIVEPRNLWLPIGFLFQDAVQACKGFLREPRKVLAGGPMTGVAQAGLAVPVTAGTDAILALPPEIAREMNEQPCVRCNRCVDACPVSISPAMITLAAEQEEFEEAAGWGVRRCIECGVCGYVCPSERPMLDLIRSAKARTGDRA